MKTAVIVFPGSNCDRDMAVALRRATDRAPVMVWHKDAALPEGLDMVAIPGGFSFGDYLRCGAIAARSPVMRAVTEFAVKGGIVLGVCNGFQVLIEAGLLPGALMRNAGLRFVCRDVHLKVETASSPFTSCYQPGEIIRMPVAHHDGNFIASPELLVRLDAEDRVAFRYAGVEGRAAAAANPNGSAADIAGVLSENRRVLGMMPHPERHAEPAHGGVDGARLFESLAGAMAR
ncbi:phosphoribosylformylglycinamidine synthase subunit PurQ [Pikeienuella piscinae]|uniref:Phosphoribosylformylglycinamidine synthase subunit PurQ n=1 Tax=Pikeienuella piscinae TaxID=2748098 RepID=A0A7L5BWM0_9RHOB|nr:phosphoribosylformylglycinamidine synthase subunit PurQ [Pikeienuella piscinae]QIE53989.1 phosphoribosylformylglycinamidine synthase subunit PurQ [Pikeienuella piscinae]